MDAQNLVQNFLEEAMREGTQSARISLYCRRDFISVTEDELLVAMAHAVKDAEEDGGARWWYLLIIVMGLLSAGFSTATVISRNITEVMFYMMVGVSAAGGVIAWQYFLGSSAESVGSLRFWQVAKCMIQGDFHHFKVSETVCFT